MEEGQPAPGDRANLLLSDELILQGTNRARLGEVRGGSGLPSIFAFFGIAAFAHIRIQ